MISTNQLSNSFEAGNDNHTNTSQAFTFQELCQLVADAVHRAVLQLCIQIFGQILIRHRDIATWKKEITDKIIQVADTNQKFMLDVKYLQTKNSHIHYVPPGIKSTVSVTPSLSSVTTNSK